MTSRPYARRYSSSPASGAHDVELLFAEIGKSMGGYLRGQTVASLSTGAMAMVGLFIVGIPYAFLLGALTFVLNYIPYVGPFITAPDCGLDRAVRFAAQGVLAYRHRHPCSAAHRQSHHAEGDVLGSEPSSHADHLLAARGRYRCSGSRGCCSRFRSRLRFRACSSTTSNDPLLLNLPRLRERCSRQMSATKRPVHAKMLRLCFRPRMEIPASELR